eukprot:scaffold460_cov24-Prasinocladus_malaysianus.AAC.1
MSNVLDMNRLHPTPAIAVCYADPSSEYRYKARTRYNTNLAKLMTSPKGDLCEYAYGQSPRSGPFFCANFQQAASVIFFSNGKKNESGYDKHWVKGVTACTT